MPSSRLPGRRPSRDEAAGGLWARWLAVRDPATRAGLVEVYTPLVRTLAARRYARRASAELEYNDFVQFGMVGLLESIDRFRPDRGARFETFATYRIEGAILNGVQSLSELQAQVMARRRVVQERSQSMAANQAARASAGALDRLADVAIGLAIGFMLEDAGLFVDDERAMPDNAYARVELRQLRERMAELVGQLPEQERFVIHRHYFQQLRFDDLAAQLGVTKARVSQVHHAGLARLRLLLR